MSRNQSISTVADTAEAEKPPQRMVGAQGKVVHESHLWEAMHRKAIALDAVPPQDGNPSPPPKKGSAVDNNAANKAAKGTHARATHARAAALADKLAYCCGRCATGAILGTAS